MIKKIAFVLILVGVLVGMFLGKNREAKKDIKTINTKTSDALHSVDDPQGNQPAPGEDQQSEGEDESDDSEELPDAANEQSFINWIEKDGNIQQLTADGSSLLMMAIDAECARCINILLEKGVDINVVNQNGQSALSSAIIAGNLDLVKTLISRGARIDSYHNNLNYNLIMHVAATGQNELLKELVKNQAKTIIDQQERQGMTALMYASKEGFADTVKILLELGSNKDLKNEKGENAKSLAIKYGHSDLAQIL
ncbi:MAG: hypothetical protein Fur0010_08830 [Bdellovibrio sp.]